MVEEEEIYDEGEADLEEQFEKEKEIQDEVYGETAPLEKKDDLYSLFWKVVKTTDSSKVANLDKEELGMLDISVRDCQNIALLAETLGHSGFARFFLMQAELVLATSASKTGWLPELFVSQRKFTAKTQERKSNLPQLQQPQKRKGLFRR